MDLRLEWCQWLAHWTKYDWRNVCFTDESPMQEEPNFADYVTRPVDEKDDPDCTRHKPKHYSLCMFWGMISGSFGKGPFIQWNHRAEDKRGWGRYMTAMTYHEHIMNEVVEYMADKPHLIYQQDNARLIWLPNMNICGRATLFAVSWFGHSDRLTLVLLKQFGAA
ncbi:MAG: hypothetical protein M1829_000198 [Trizodia sp. TS-e1964]|nr:MAG: hypothetical protein M1829_000198 [Trizodia sp. TS-e1964]